MNKIVFNKITSMAVALVLAVTLSVTAFAADSENVKLKNPGQGEKLQFEVGNMFPGDTVAKEYIVTVNHREPLDLYFYTEITQPADLTPEFTLDEVLQIKVEVNGSAVYDGLIGGINGEANAKIQSLAANEKEATYKITASLATSVGNDYMNKTLVADFVWKYLEEPEPSPSPEPTPKPTQKPDSGTTGGSTTGGGTSTETADANGPANTSDIFDMPLYYSLMIGSALGIALLLLFKKRKDEAEQNG